MYTFTSPSELSKITCSSLMGHTSNHYRGSFQHSELLLFLQIMAEHYPRGNKELKGSFFSMHSPLDTMSWFTDRGIKLKVIYRF